MTKKITLSLLLLIGCLFSQHAMAQLNTGDIVFVAFRFDGNDQDGNCEDGFAFAALVDIPANTTIYFTEDESNGTGFITGEGSISWVHTEMVPEGTVVDIVTHVQTTGDYCGGTNPSPSANIGTVQFEGATGSWTISTTAEEIYAYLGAVQAPTTWLAALWTDNSDNSNTLPAALNGFLLDFTDVDQDTDMGILTSGTDCPDRATCLANALNLDNWTTENETGADCCDDNGVNYPGDIPSALGACIQPTITGIDVITCAVPGELSTFQVNGELNGAEHWVWYFGSCDEEPTSAPLNLGNEFTFAFFPIFHDSTFIVRAEGGCADVGAACFEYTPNTLFGPTSFTALEDLCASVGIQSGLGSGTPTGGTYSGPGVTDDGNGMSYSFDPAAAGAGMHEISYTNECGWSISDMVEVYALPEVTLSLSDTILVDLSMPLVNFPGTGMPVGGIYTDNFDEITDDGNGTTFSFDTLVLNLKTIIYTYTDPITGCTNSTSTIIRLVQDPATSIDEVDQNLNFEVFPNPTNGQLQLMGIQVDEVQIIDALGKMVMRYNKPDFSLDISTLPSGIYFLKANKDRRFKTIRIIKE